MNFAKKTLFLLVVSSNDKTRNDFALKTINSINEQKKFISIENQFVVFDNDSTFRDHLEFIPKGSIICKSSKNIGYWSAINWILNNYKNFFSRIFSYIYIMESDCDQYNLKNIYKCQNWLDKNRSAASVRCQNYHKKFRIFYDKKFSFLPFYKKHQAVQHFNVITNKKVKFDKFDKENNIYSTNFHTKLPALTRLDYLLSVFKILEKRKSFTEHDFIYEFQKKYKETGLYDGGIYKNIHGQPSDTVISGSFTNKNRLEELNYFQTRKDKIRTSNFRIKVDYC